MSDENFVPIKLTEKQADEMRANSIKKTAAKAIADAIYKAALADTEELVKKEMFWWEEVYTMYELDRKKKYVVRNIFGETPTIDILNDSEEELERQKTVLE